MSTFPLFNTESLSKLSAEESAELAMHVAQLAQAGLPLDVGLRALADELPSRRMARVLRRLAGQLSSGMPLDAAIESQGAALPAHLRGLILAGTRTGRLAAVLDEFVAMTRRQRDLRRRAVLSLAYPALLLVMMALLAAFLNVYIVDEFVKVFKDFGCKLPTLTELVFAASSPIAWGMGVGVAMVLAAMLLGFLTPLGGWLSRIARWVPIAGPILRWGGLAQLTRLLAMLVEQQVPLPQALRLAAAGLRDRALADDCHQVASAVETGLPLEACLDASAAHFPPTLAELAAWGQRTGALGEAFRASADMFDARARAQGVLMQTLLPPLAFLAITFFAALCIIAMLLPMVSLISNLSK